MIKKIILENAGQVTPCALDGNYVAVKLSNNAGYVFLDGSANKIFETSDSDVTVSVNNFGAYKKEADGNYKAYCFKDRDFTINGKVEGSGIASIKKIMVMTLSTSLQERLL